MQIILNSIQELKELTSLIGGKVPEQEHSAPVKTEELKTDNKPAAEKTKKDKPKDKKENATSDNSTVKSVAEKDKYYYHAESDSYWMLPKGEEIPSGIDFGNSYEVSKEEYEKGNEKESEEENPVEEANITKEMVRAICSKAIKAGKSAEVKNIVSKYGASKLPDLNEECYADAYKDVEALS